MDFRQLISKLDTIAEAGQEANSNTNMFGYEENGDGTVTDPKTGERLSADGTPESDAYKNATKNVPQSTPATAKSAPAAQQSAQQPATATDSPAQQPAQNDPKKLELLKQLNDVTAKLFQLNQGSIESGKYESFKSDIAKSLMESFNIFEAPEDRNALVANATEIAKQLEPFKSQPDVAQALSKLQQASAAPKKPGPMYAVDQTKIKRFQELMAKAQGGAKSAAAPAAKPAGGSTAPAAPAAKPEGGAAAQPAAPAGTPNVPANQSVASLSPDKIKELQNALNASGEKLKVDGVVGSNTTEAMKKHPEIVNQIVAGE